MRRLAVALALLAAAAPAMAGASKRPATPPPAEPQEPAPPPPVTLELVPASSPGTPWRLVATSRASAPVTLAFDPRLLSLELQAPTPPAPEAAEPPAGKSRKARAPEPKPRPPLVCRLPGALRPAAPDAAFVVTLAPGEAAERAFDPRLFCADESGALKAGATLRAVLGWDPPDAAPLRRPLGTLTGEHAAPIGTLATPAVTLPESATPAGAPSASSCSPPTPELRFSRGSDAATPNDVLVTFELTNPCSTTQRLYFRRDLAEYEIRGPGGVTRCGADRVDRRPEPTALITLRPGERLPLTTRLFELCPTGTFKYVGLYEINATLDASRYRADLGPAAFSGTLATPAPALVRVATGQGEVFPAPGDRAPAPPSESAKPPSPPPAPPPAPPTP